MASIARKNLLEDIPRFLVAQAGIMFAVSLVTIQTGLQTGFSRSSSQLIDQSQADLWVASQKMEHLRLTLPLAYERVAQAQAVEGVEKAEGILLKGELWQDETSNEIAAVTLIGADPQGLLFNQSNLIEGGFEELEEPYTVITDETNLDSLKLEGIGQEGQINHLPAKLVGLTQGTQSIVIDNMLFTSLKNANAYRTSRLTEKPTTPPEVASLSENDLITFVLIKAEAGQDLNTLTQRLEEALPNTQVLTRSEMAHINQMYWEKRSGIGFILGLGAFVGVVVGVVVVGQILYASVSDHLKEFGTLKAMGASDWFIYRTIIEQGLWMGILGYTPGIAICLGVSAWTATTQGIVIMITPVGAIAVLGLTVGMCITSAIFAIQKVTRVDPVIVFKG